MSEAGRLRPLWAALPQQCRVAAAVCQNNFVLGDFRFSADHGVLFSGHGVALTGLAGRWSPKPSPRGKPSALMRTPSLAVGMLWHRLKDAL